jgi:hypothetical protein
MTQLTLLPLLGLITGTAQATSEARCPYATAYAEQVIDVEDFDYDSDWQPADSPIQVRLVIHAGNTIALDMLGDAVYDWSAGTVVLEAEPEGGSYALDLGLSITSSLRFDLMGISWEGEVGDPIAFLVEDLVFFQPYLLPGNPDSPLDVTTEVEKQTVVDYSAVDLYVASASLQVALSGSLNTWFETLRVSLIPEGVDGGDAELTVADQPELLGLAEVEPLESAGATAQLEGDVLFTPDLHAWPSVVVELFGSEYTLAEFDIPIDLPTVEATWLFEPEPIAFERPEPIDPGDTGDTSDTGIEDVTIDEPGCGCATRRGAGALGFAWLLLGAVMLRRRGS